MSSILANNSIYNSNISGAMNFIERKQAMENSTYGFVNQFDDLRFDNISTPSSINESHTTITGINTSLQRNLDFHNNYSEFQNSDMHFDVVSKDQFVHNNMTPHTSHRDFDVNADRTIRKLENFTGAFEYYKPKKEAPHLFDPMKNMSFVNGMPAITSSLTDRYLPSNKNNNGNLPFETNVKVIPGVDKKNQLGSHSVYRILPKNVDHLRSDINQKITYGNKPLETVKKGEFRGPNPYITKYKMPDFREMKTSDFVSSRANIEGPAQTGAYTNVDTMRNEKEHYILKPAVSTNRGKRASKDTTNFTPAKKENYLNDNARSVSTNSKQIVMTNAASYNNYNNQRSSTNSNYIAHAKKIEPNSYVIDYKDIPLTTVRQLMIHNDNILGAKTDQSTYVFSNDMVLPVTNRQINNTTDILGPSNYVKMGATYNNDPAKTTQRPFTNYYDTSNVSTEIKHGMLYNNDVAKITQRPSTNYSDAANISNDIKNGMVYNNDVAKITQRPSTNYSEAANISNDIKNGMVYNDDIAKPTIKQTTLISTYSAMVTNPITQSYARDAKEIAKITQREGMDNTQYVGHLSSLVDNTYVRDYTDIAKTTTRQQTENTQYIGNINSQDNEKTYVKDYNDIAKTTTRQQTENTQYIGHLNSLINESTYSKDYTDTAKPTIRQTTLVPTPGGRVSNISAGNYTNITDDMKKTIKETTLLKDYKGVAHGEIEQKISHEAASNMSCDDRREISTYNRPANGKSDDYGPYINEATVQLNEPILYSHFPNPLKNLDYSVMPSTVINKSKPVIESSSYYINPNFINTLKNNPLVNDMFHQKNI